MFEKDIVGKAFEVLELDKEEQIEKFINQSENPQLVKDLLLSNYNKDEYDKDISARYEYLVKNIPSDIIMFKAIKYYAEFCKKDKMLEFFVKNKHKNLTDKQWEEIFVETRQACLTEILKMKNFPQEVLDQKAIQLFEQYKVEDAMSYIKTQNIDVNHLIPTLASLSNVTALNALYSEMKNDISQKTTDQAFLNSLESQNNDSNNSVFISNLPPISQSLKNEDNSVVISDGEEEVTKDKSELSNVIDSLDLDSVSNTGKNQNQAIINNLQQVTNTNKNAFNFILSQNISKNALKQGINNGMANNQFKQVKRIVIEKNMETDKPLEEIIEKKQNQLNVKEKFSQQVHGDTKQTKEISNNLKDLSDLKETIKPKKTPSIEEKHKQKININPKDIGLEL